MGQEACKRVRVSLYVPFDVHRFVIASCERTITSNGKVFTFNKTQNEAYIEFIKRGILSLEQDDEK